MKIKFKKLNENAVIPKRATEGSAGMDLCACISNSVVISPGRICVIPLGLAAEVDSSDVALLIYARSGLASKYGITLANSVGVIDSDYRGEWKIPLINLGTEPFTVESGMRIAQLVVTPIIRPDIDTTDELTDTQRGVGGFGSTGLNK